MYDKDPQGNVVGKLKRCSGKKLEYLEMIIDYSRVLELSVRTYVNVHQGVNQAEWL